ncbi:DKNYY domain-containing protein [Aquirufa sp.]|jgi:hypothetical protein|uniref:DKNYY domain-containing protein n=1 Tax=Aquirufa sp. TaxID=2676249 RepID=UPI0037BF0A3E
MKNKHRLTFIILLIASFLIVVSIFKSRTENKIGDNASSKTKIESEEIKKCEKYLEKLDSIKLTSEWKLLKCGLWQNKYGEIGFKTHSVICSDGQVIAETYITKFGFNENPPLKNIIDTATFRELGNTFYKDKNHIYHHYSMSDGGSFYVFDKADYQTFQILGDCYAKDKNHIFEMRAGILKNVDYKTFKTKKGLTGCVAKDKNGFIIWGERVKIDEIEDEYLKRAVQELNKE